MSSELPSSSGRSVFSVFGFGSGHYSQDEDFNSPLESAPESFDASNSLTALTKKKKKVPLEETVMEHSPETATRVRVNLPDQSGMVLQSFSQSSKQVHPPSLHSSVRRYSTAQEEADDVLNSSEVLTKFNTTLSQTTYMLTKAGGSSTNIYNSVNKDSGDSCHTLTPSLPVLTRVKSSPHLSVMPSFLGSPHKESHHASDIILQWRRHQSQSDLLEVVEYKTDGGGDAASHDPSGAQAVAVPSAAVPLSVTANSPKLPEIDVTDTDKSYNSGFGILSRTRQFGAWLTKATEGEKVEVTKKDLNVLAPNSF